ncbi:MAG TPA: helix-turn-helix domain-containing protein [Xanthobacteraceae bacterium]|nr:helix-turn-helix domain-containing protein [Xanthobacteraceae bacterium]
MQSVELIALKGALASGLAITADVLATANRMMRQAGKAPAFALRVTGSAAPALRPMLPRLPPARGPADIVILPGVGFGSERAIHDGLTRPDVGRARKRLLHAHRSGAWIVASCSSVFILASTGLLAERSATTTWWLAPLFRRLFPEVRLQAASLVVTDGRFITAGAAMAQTEAMLALTARVCGASIARLCARYLLLDERPSQEPYMTLAALVAADPHVARVHAWALKRIDTRVPIAEMAAAVGLSHRTLARRVAHVTGLSPVRFLQRLRLERALHLMDTTRLPFETIAARVGYAESSTLRRLFKDSGLGARAMRSRPSPGLERHG